MGALGIVIGCALSLSPVAPAELSGVKSLAREKAAAVALLKRKAAHRVVTLAHDRMFVAYLNATTQGEGARIRARIMSVFEALLDRAGVREMALIDRSGAYVVRAGADGGAAATLDAGNPVLATGFAQGPRGVATIVASGTVTFAAPVVWREQKEFVLSARQSLSAYKRALARGVGADRFVVLIDDKGTVLSDTRAAGGKTIAGLSLDALRKAVKGGKDAGAGTVERDGSHYRVSYQAVGRWTVVAAEVTKGARCAKRADRPCG